MMRPWYIPASSEPLSADIGIIEGESYLWFFDVGNGEDSFRQLELVRSSLQTAEGAKKPCCAVLSHFHPDHIGNIGRLDCEKIYVSANTLGYLPPEKQKLAVTVGSPMIIRDGVELEIFPIPSSHARGCLGLTVGRSLTWIGDAAYATRKKGKTVYNANLLQEQIAQLEGLETDALLLSHRKDLEVKREALLKMLRDIYGRRVKDSPYIEVED